MCSLSVEWSSQTDSQILRLRTTRHNYDGLSNAHEVLFNEYYRYFHVALIGDEKIQTKF